MPQSSLANPRDPGGRVSRQAVAVYHCHAALGESADQKIRTVWPEVGRILPAPVTRLRRSGALGAASDRKPDSEPCLLRLSGQRRDQVAREVAPIAATKRPCAADSIHNSCQYLEPAWRGRDRYTGRCPHRARAGGPGTRSLSRQGCRTCRHLSWKKKLRTRS